MRVRSLTITHGCNAVPAVNQYVNQWTMQWYAMPWCRGAVAQPWAQPWKTDRP